jgi:class I fructose-bisphosphate aldolase
MNGGKQQRLYRILNPKDGRAVCVAADHGWMSDFTPNVAELRRIVRQVVEGGADAILLSLGQAMRLGDLLKGRTTPALLIRADWMNMPRLGGSNVANAIPQQELRHLAIASAQDALNLGASAITIYLFLGFDDETEALNLEDCAVFAQECRRIGLVCIIEPLAVGASVTGANIVDILITGARMAVEVGADMLKIPFTGDAETFRRLVQTAGVPVLALGGARSERDSDALELVAEALEAGGAGTVFGRNVTKAPDPAKMVRDLVALVHEGKRVEDVLPVQKPGIIQLKGLTERCTGCLLCEVNCSLSHDYGGNPLYSTVKIYTPQPDRAIKRKWLYTPRHCTLCNVCVEKCPEGALYIANGMVNLVEEKCNTCQECVKECPLGVIAFRDDHPIFCDLCGGDPACARTCPENAILMLERENGHGAE